MTERIDNPSSSVPVSTRWIIHFSDPDRADLFFADAGAEDAARRAFENAKHAWTCGLFMEVDSTGFRPSSEAHPVQRLIDSALASQEARHKKERDDAHLASLTVISELIERHRQEMEEAKRCRNLWAELAQVAQYKLEAAEQREREAGERAASLKHALNVITGGGWDNIDAGAIVYHWRTVASNALAADAAALAAIRPAPSPVSAPVYTGVDWGVNSSSFTVEVPVSPVEPGSDPQEPETR